jgi:hypothetical protein
MYVCWRSFNATANRDVVFQLFSRALVLRHLSQQLARTPLGAKPARIVRA